MRKFNLPPRGDDPRWPKARQALLALGTVAAEDADYAKSRNGQASPGLIHRRVTLSPRSGLGP